MRIDRDEYKWVRDALVGQESVKRVLLPKRKRRITLPTVLGWMMVVVSLTLMFASMFK